ncbi:hypothetical protein J4417_00140 [Candidatus Woesearchaeota archaeon]|nr:hypothetical protein [Candidatus Woesearchaeota archaeon]
MIEKITRRGFLGTVVGGLTALVLASGCATSSSGVRTQEPSVTSSVSTTKYDSVSKRFDRLRELERPMGGASASMNGYVMGAITEVKLKIIAGVYSGTVKVTSDGEGSFSAKGTYFPLAHPEAMERATKEADVNSDKIITYKEAEELTQKVFREYAVPESFPRVDEGIDAEGDLYKKVHDGL